MYTRKKRLYSELGNSNLNTNRRNKVKKYIPSESFESLLNQKNFQVNYIEKFFNQLPDKEKAEVVKDDEYRILRVLSKSKFFIKIRALFGS